MFRSLAIRAGLLCFALAPLATVASAQIKMAVVNVQKAMLDSDELKKASAQVEAKFKPKQDELQKMQADLQSIQQQLQSNKLTPQAQADLQLQGQRKQRDAQRLSEDLQQEFDRDRQEILGKAAQKMQEVVKKLAEEKGYDVVLDVSQALYIKPALDITTDALAAYNKAYPGKIVEDSKMSGYLDQYGAGEEERNRLIIRSVVALVSLVVLVSLSWYLLKNHHQEGVVKAFLADVRRGDYQAAYSDWGCTPANPCSGYSFDKFKEDWAGVSRDAAPDPAVLGITDSESCNTGVLLTVAVNATRQEKLWVDKDAAQSKDAISFAPYPICPHKSPFAIMIHRTIGKLRKPLLK